MREAIHDFVTLLVIVDPIGTAVMFLGLTPHASARHRHSMAWRGTLLATLIFLAFAVAGQSGRVRPRRWNPWACNAFATAPPW